MDRAGSAPEDGGALAEAVLAVLDRRPEFYTRQAGVTRLTSARYTPVRVTPCYANRADARPDGFKTGKRGGPAVPAKSKHMERRKQRIANAKKNARLAGRLRRRRRLQAAFGLLAIVVLLTAGYLWQSGFFESEEPAEDPAVTESPAADLGGTPADEPSEEPSEPSATETEATSTETATE
jgi:hypothetical protein